jgi:hypothetical protein
MRKYFTFFLAALFLVFGCSKKHAPQFSGYEDGLASRGFVSENAAGYTRWEGTGYNPEGAAGIEAATPTAFKDMSNLYGRMSDESPAEAASRTNADKPEYIAENVERKIVRRANIRVRVENLETAEIAVNGLMEKYGAYAASTFADENSRRYTIRVPSAVYREFLAGTAGMGKVITRTESAEDVTLRYYDLEGRLGTNKELLKTFQAYLGKAKNIEEILSVEERIAELQSEIDSTGKDLRRLSNDVDYSIVELNIFESGVAVTQYPTLLDNVKGLFRGFAEFLSVLLVILIGIVVYGIPIALLLVFFFWLLFGKVGLLKKLWRLAAGRKKAGEDKSA